MSLRRLKFPSRCFLCVLKLEVSWELTERRWLLFSHISNQTFYALKCSMTFTPFCVCVLYCLAIFQFSRHLLCFMSSASTIILLSIIKDISQRTTQTLFLGSSALTALFSLLPSRSKYYINIMHTFRCLYPQQFNKFPNNA